MLIIAIDVGSPRNFAWASSCGISGSGSADNLVDTIIRGFQEGKKVTLGFEAPLWTPRERSFDRMTANRGGIEADLSRPWSAGAGCGALAAGLANMAFVFRELHAKVGAVNSTTKPERFTGEEAQMLIWEAFVSGAVKGTHLDDAKLAVDAFRKAWPQLRSEIRKEPVLNLATASLLATGHKIDIDEIGTQGVVVAARQKQSTRDKPNQERLAR